MEVILGILVLAFIIFVGHKALKNRKADDVPNGIDIEIEDDIDDENSDGLK